MNEAGTYFQFPLCALAICETEKERLEHIISFGFIEAGIAMFRKLDAEIRNRKRSSLRLIQEPPMTTSGATTTM